MSIVLQARWWHQFSVTLKSSHTPTLWLSFFILQTGKKKILSYKTVRKSRSRTGCKDILKLKGKARELPTPQMNNVAYDGFNKRSPFYKWVLHWSEQVLSFSADSHITLWMQRAKKSRCWVVARVKWASPAASFPPKSRCLDHFIQKRFFECTLCWINTPKRVCGFLAVETGWESLSLSAHISPEAKWKEKKKQS